jgi:myo-inositol-1(or 4)-monophosphatase
MEDLMGIAAGAARAAGALLLEHFAGPRTGVGTKSSSTDMVTDADRAAEATIVDAIRAVRPDDALLGEEGGAREGTSGWRWVIDPLDGTTNFLFGVPQWAVSIACEDADGVAVAVIFDAIRDELFAASRGAGATMNGGPIEVTGATDLARALIATGFSYRPDERAAAARMLTWTLPRVRDVRRAGAASLDLAWVAAGRLDGYYEVPTEWWDVAAGGLLVREAGGEVTGIAPAGDAGPGTLAAGPGVFGALRDLVAEASARAGHGPHR